MVEYTGDLPSFDAGPTELVVERIRGFECEPVPMGAEMVLGDIENDPGATVLIKGAGDCYFELTHRSAGGVDTTLSTMPRSFLFAEGVYLSDDDVTVVCASALNHEESANPGVRETQSVDVECWARFGDASVQSVMAVPPDNEFAAWTAAVTPNGVTAGAVSLLWVRDFSFQFFNLSDNGRPDTDGVYETTLLLGANSITIDETLKVSDSTTAEDETIESWAPTPEETELLSPYMVMPDVLDGGYVVNPAPADGGTADAG